MKKTHRQDTPNRAAAVAAAIDASKVAAPTLTDTQKLRLFEACREFDAANHGASPDAICEDIKALMHERIQRLQAAKASLEGVAMPFCPDGWTLDPRTGTFTKK